MLLSSHVCDAFITYAYGMVTLVHCTGQSTIHTLDTIRNLAVWIFPESLTNQPDHSATP